MHFKKLLAQSLLWRGLNFASLLLVNIFLARFLRAEWVGWVYYVCNIFSLIVLVASLNMDAAVTYFASGEKINANKLFWLGFVWCAIVVSLLWGLLQLFIPWMPAHDLLQPADVIGFALLYISGIILINVSTALFYGQRNFQLPNLIVAVVNFCFLLFISFQKDHSSVSLLYVLHIYFFLFIVQGVLLAAAFFFKNKSWGKMQLPSFNENKKIYSYATVALLGNILFFFVYRIDYWFVQYYCTATQMGNYVQVSKLGQMMLIVPQILASAVFAQTAGGYQISITRESVMIISRLLSALYAVVFSVILITGKWVFPFVFGQSFDLMYIPFLVLLPGIWALSVLALVVAYFAGKGNLRINVIGGLLSVFVMGAGDFIFLPRGGGIIMAALISSISYISYMLLLLYRFNKESATINFNNMFLPSKKDMIWLMGFLEKNKAAV